MTTKKNTPLVSIHCITYNHKDYIAQAIESFLMQKTNFSFEIVIAEDYSTDGTREIVFGYAKKYPDLIRVVTSDENVGMNQNSYRSLITLKGKYIAFCEGDDYWTDPLKLQKQVDFLEENLDYGMVHTNGFLYMTASGKKQIIHNLNSKIFIEKNSSNIFLEILLGNYNILTCSVCLRSDIFHEIDFDDFNKRNFMMGDTFLWLEYAYRSKIKLLSEPMVVHNILRESASKSQDLSKVLDFSKSGFELEKYIASKHNLDDEIKRKIALRRYGIFLDIAFRGRLKKNEGIDAFHQIRSLAKKRELNLKHRLQYYSIRAPLLYSISPILLKIINRLGLSKK